MNISHSYSKLQAVLFGNYTTISQSPGTIKHFMEKFEKFNLIPSAFQEVVNGQILNRIAFVDLTDHIWSIEFGSTRIDIKHSNIKKSDLNIDSNKFLEDIKLIFTEIEAKFPLKHNRVALVAIHEFKNISDKNLNQMYNKIVSTIPYYQDNKITDMNVRSVTRIPFKVEHIEDTMNVISEIKRFNEILPEKKENVKYDKIFLHLDINTYQKNTDFRFNLEDVNHIYSYFFNVEKKLSNQYFNQIRIDNEE